MYQSFTGSSRRPRQVNLSGRKPNPFATAGSLGGPQQAIQNAQQDRLQRQQQRAELNAAKNVQRTWRGYSARKKARDAWRQQWDATEKESEAGGAIYYRTAEESLTALRKLLLFFSIHQEDDTKRLVRYGQRQMETVAAQIPCSDGPWVKAYSRLEEACLEALGARVKKEQVDGDTEHLLRITTFTAEQSSDYTVLESYYSTLAAMSRVPLSDTTTAALISAITSPLRTGSKAANTELFVSAYLTMPQSPETLSRLATSMDISLLAQAAYNVVTKSVPGFRHSLWLLGQYIYMMGQPGILIGLTGARNVVVFARLLAAVSDGISPETTPVAMGNLEFDKTVLSSGPAQSSVPLNEFLHQQLNRLVDQEGIRSLIVRPDSQPTMREQHDDAQMLAGYALTLLRVFPHRADDIRMWLYLGPPSGNDPDQPVSAIAYFWKESCATGPFRSIYENPRNVIDMLKPKQTATSTWQPPNSVAADMDKRDNEWRVILTFLELYTFVLKIMDDEEFLGGTKGVSSRNNALSIPEIRDLTIFLKNLGFTMYFSAAEITTFADLGGISVDYVKGLVTGLLRMIYERDSRRGFLPKGHWLMTRMLDMTNFISAVVMEEENRHQVQDMEDEDGADSDLEDDSWVNNAHRSTQEARLRERRMRAQRQASRKRYLESVAPRLEILQNMPFFIPFEIRVQIFREFVNLDKHKRRNGFVDPDVWRQSILFSSRGIGDERENELARHHAKIRRKHEFEDAFEHFYQLGEGLKEPIQITFVDEFDMVEAGIDGGGVTKEFLTSVSSQAFDPERALFSANDKHLLYPNPTSVEEAKVHLAQAGLRPETPEYRGHLQELAQQYEFLGRIIGKCMYEGILVDISFASFFLLKWSLTGLPGTAPRESQYRANINDLRDLDEALYQGLLYLKNYPGNVEEDLSLNFTVTDTIPLGNGATKTVEHELMTNGANIPVTNENRLIYISRMARYRLQAQSAPQTNAFLKGLSSIIQPGWLSMFNQSELQTLIGGASTPLSIPDLRKNTQYGGVYVIGNDQQEHPVVRMFWDVMEALPDADRRKVLKFVTSTPRAPLLGFASLNPRFSIRDAGDDENRFPTTSTCVNLLKLPRYKKESTLREKLLYAVNSGAGFDLS